MALDDGEKPEAVCYSKLVSEAPRNRFLLVLRLVAFFATAAATVIMALNKQTNTMVVATIGSTPITATLTAKFQYTPAFVYFVIANGMASLHNLLMIVVEIWGDKFDYKGLRLVMIAVLDTMTLALASGGDGAATFMAELGKHGNSHARWNKICDKFGSFCDRGSAAIISSFVGLLLLVIITVLSIRRLVKPRPATLSPA